MPKYMSMYEVRLNPQVLFDLPESFRIILVIKIGKIIIIIWKMENLNFENS